MQIAARMAMFSASAKEATLRDFMNGIVEEIVIDPGIEGYFRLYLNGYTALRRIEHLGFGTVPRMEIISNVLFQNCANMEFCKIPCSIGSFSGCKKLKEAHIYSFTLATSTSFMNTGVNSDSCDIHIKNDTAESIATKFNSALYSGWNLGIVFHCGDGNRVVYDPVSAAWVIEPDTASAPVSSSGGGY